MTTAVQANRIEYMQRSSFYDSIERAVNRSDGLRKPVVVQLDPGGYERVAHVTIVSHDHEYFRAYWKGVPKRFSVRLRAAATVLRDHGLFGEFWLCHLDRRLLILPCQSPNPQLDPFVKHSS